MMTWKTPCWGRLSGLAALVCFFLPGLRSALGEPHWEYLNPFPVAGNVMKVSHCEDGSGFLLTEAGIMVRSTDGGRVWSRMELPEGCQGFLDLTFFDRDHGWCLGSQDVEEPLRQWLYWTEDGGGEWGALSLGSEQQAASYTGMFFLNSTTGWVCGSLTSAGSTQPAVARVVNRQVTEVIAPQGLNVRLNEVVFQNASVGITVGQHGYVAYTETGGQSWTAVARRTDLELLSVGCADFYGCAVGGDFDTGIILNSSDGGENWSAQENHPADSRLVKVSAGEDGSWLAVCSGWGAVPGRMIYTGFLDGRDWDTVYNADSRQVLRTMSGSSRIWLGGDNGYLVELDRDRGFSATVITRDLLPGSVHSAFFLNDRNGWFAGANGRLLSTINGGSTLNLVATGFQNTILNAVFTDVSNGILTCDLSGEFRTDNGGRSWTALNISDENVNLIAFKGARGFATHGTQVSTSEDGGRSWTSREVIRGSRVPAIALSAPADTVAYVASTGDSLRRTLDGGRTWSAVSAPFANCYGVSFVNPQYGWALAPAAQGGIRLYHTANYASTWQNGPRFDFIPNGVHFYDRLNGWIWANPGRVLVTSDGDTNWTDLEIGVERIIRRIHVDRPNRLWVVGDGGLIARWGENWLSAPLDESPEPPASLMLLQAYPNPANGFINFNCNLPVSGWYRLTVFDLMGRVVMNPLEFQGFSGASSSTLDLSALPSGCYQAFLEGGGSSRFTQFVLLK